MRRRRFLACLGSAPVIWPIIAAAQPADRVRRVGVLIPNSPGPQAQLIVEVIKRQLSDLGWADATSASTSITRPITTRQGKPLENSSGCSLM